MLINIFKGLYKEFVDFMKQKHGETCSVLVSEGGYSALNNNGVGVEGGGWRAW